MCVCALLTWIRKEWISVRLFVYKWTHSRPKRRRSADLRVSMQPRQRSSRHKQLHNTTCLRTALKNPVKCSKWCKLKKKERKKEAKSACHCGCLLFFKWVLRVFQCPADNHFDSHWHLSVGKVHILNILFQDKDLFRFKFKLQNAFFLFVFLEKKGKDWRCVLYPMKLTPPSSAKCWMQDVILCPVTCTVKKTWRHISPESLILLWVLETYWSPGSLHNKIQTLDSPQFLETHERMPSTLQGARQWWRRCFNM